VGEHEAATPEPLQRFLDMLELERIDRDLFRAWNPPAPAGRRARTLFGGQVAAHALRAATLTVNPEHYPHSLHGYFLRPGKDEAPTVLRVDRIRDGRSFSTRTVVAQQDGEAIFTLTASFHHDEPGGEFATPIATDIPGPDVLFDQHGLAPMLWGVESPFDRLEVPGLSHMEPSEEPRRAMWIRTRAALPDDPGLHACVITFLSDFGALGAVRTALGRLDTPGMAASLDHALWFHRQVRADEWLLFDVSSKSNAGARGLAVGSMHTADGRHVVTMAQEGLVRLSD
jgi:acyl-CoA thioesterase-2